LLGVSFLFAAIITGLILNTMFLVREIRRRQHDAFVNAVTHELKPVTSIRLHLDTLLAREPPSPSQAA
jgi:hypothetical protein